MQAVTPNHALREAPSPRPQPKSPADLFWSMTRLALQGFGGVLAVVQRVLVEEKHWLTNEEFVEEWAVAQILPGPNVVNLALMLGDRYFGLRGALAALAGVLTFPLVLLLLLAALFASVADNAFAQGALRGMSAVSAGLIAAVGLRLIGALKSNVMSGGVIFVLAAITFIAVAIFKVPLVVVLLGLGAVATWWANRLLMLAESAKDNSASGDKP